MILNKFCKYLVVFSILMLLSLYIYIFQESTSDVKNGWKVLVFAFQLLFTGLAYDAAKYVVSIESIDWKVTVGSVFKIVTLLVFVFAALIASESKRYSELNTIFQYAYAVAAFWCAFEIIGLINLLKGSNKK